METQNENVQEPTDEKKKGWSTGAKVLLGCGIGCGAFALLIVLACGGFWIWLFRQSELPAADGLIGPDTTAMAIVRIDPTDPGAEEMIEKIGEQIDQQRYQDMPPQMRDLLRRFGGGNTAEGLKKVLPVQVVWTASYAGPPDGAPDQAQQEDVAQTGMDHHVLLVSTKFGGILKLVSWMIGRAAESDPNTKTLKHNGQRIIANENGGDAANNYVAIVENNFVLSNDLDAAKGAMDRLGNANAAFEGQGVLKRMFGRLSRDKEAIGVITNEHGEIRRFLRTKEQAPFDYDQIEVMGWEADIMSADVVKLTLYVECGDEETAKQIQLNLVRLLLQERLKTGRISEVNQERDGLSVKVDFQISGLEEELEKLGEPGRMQREDD